MSLDSEISCGFDLDLAMGDSSGFDALAEAIVRRLTTTQGRRQGFPDYGFNIFNLIGSLMTDSQIRQGVLGQAYLEEDVESASLKLERVDGDIFLELAVVTVDGFEGTIALDTRVAAFTPKPYVEDLLVSLDTSNPDATIVSGEYAEVPNTGTLGGAFSQASVSLRPTQTTQNALNCAQVTASQKLASNLTGADFSFLHNGESNYLLTFAGVPSAIGALATVICGTAVLHSEAGLDFRIVPDAGLRVGVGNGSLLETVIDGASGAIVVGSPVVLQLRGLGASLELFVNNVSYGSGTISAPSAAAASYPLSTSLVVGGAFGFMGKYCELDIINGALTEGERTLIYNRRANKWGF